MSSVNVFYELEWLDFYKIVCKSMTGTMWSPTVSRSCSNAFQKFCMSEMSVCHSIVLGASVSLDLLYLLSLWNLLTGRHLWSPKTGSRVKFLTMPKHVGFKVEKGNHLLEIKFCKFSFQVLKQVFMSMGVHRGGGKGGTCPPLDFRKFVTNLLKLNISTHVQITLFQIDY